MHLTQPALFLNIEVTIARVATNWQQFFGSFVIVFRSILKLIRLQPELLRLFNIIIAEIACFR